LLIWKASSAKYDFTFTDYYDDEMGENLKKQFLSFEKLIMPDQLADIKNSTNEIETKYSIEGKRTVNLDPGYLEESKLILASTKNFSHRIYLQVPQDIFARRHLGGVDIELRFRRIRNPSLDLPRLPDRTSVRFPPQNQRDLYKPT